MVLASALPGLFLCRAQAADPGCSTLDVRGDQVTVCRDDFGRPHIFADTNRGLFEAYGYVVAQDRLWQLELNRRAARGRLAELFGPGSIPADTVARVTGYTDAELDAQFDSLDPEIQEIFIAFRDGINRYVNEVVAADPLNQLPFEFHALGIGLPAPWSLRDSVAFGGFMVRRFGEIGGRELTNQTVLNALIARHGQADGYAIFNDLRWINDPDAPVTVPADESRAAHLARETSRRTASLNSAQLVGASENWSNIVDPDEALRIWQSLGVPTKLGSYAWVVSPEQSFEGGAMLYGGPQMGFSAPEVLHEVQLTGGNGFNVTGMAFAGIPAVLIGRNDQIAWTSTTATGDNVDTYIETLCDNGNGYVFDGACIAFEERFETIIVRGADPLPLLVRRSVHGPVVSESPGFRATQKRAHWMRELETAAPFLTFDRAANLEEFDAAVRQVVTSHNFLYADQQGNIAYWQAGQVPLRPEGFDLRLPLPGDGSAEWPGGILAVPASINPARGWLANWNNKPSVDYNNADSQIFGKQFRVLDIADRLSPGPISLEDMRDIPKDIARVGSLGREARFLKPYLIDALDAVPPSHPLAAQARAVLEAWRGDAFAEAVTSTTLEPGQVIFSAWLDRVLNLAFADELGSQIGEAGTNLLIHVLDDALDGGSSVPPSRDYFNGEDPNVIISRAFDQALTALGPNPAAWSAVPRGNITFTHPLIGAVGSIPNSNRSTYGQIILLTQPEIQSENIFTLGQSGFIRLVPPSGFALDSNFRDQLDIFRLFQYKPMLLLPGPDAKK
jgi:penicillin amidase